MIKTSATQLATAVAEELLREMRVGKYSKADRLPPETEAAKEMGVSRTALRDGIAILEREGFVTRKWGIGTIVNHHVLDVRARLDLEEEFLDLIEHCGMKGSIRNVKTEHAAASAKEAKKLDIPEGAPVIRVSRTALADGIPAIYSVDTIPEEIIADRECSDSEFEAPIFDFLRSHCKKEIMMDLTDIHALAASGEVSRALEVREGEPVLYLDEAGYDLYGKPVLHSDEYYREGIITQTILRKKIG